MLTKEYLAEQFINKRISISKIAKNVHLAKVTIIKAMEKFGIFSNSYLANILTKEYLQENYYTKNLSSGEIAKIVGCDSTTVIDYILKVGLKVKSYSEGQKGKTGKHNKGRKHSPEHIEKLKKAHYIDGRTPLNNLIHNLAEYRAWRLAIFQRDNYTCQDCGIKNSSGLGKTVYLEAHHHLKEFHILVIEFLQQYSQFSPLEDKETLVRLAINYAPFWDISNGKTSCLKCHEVAHNIKGTKKEK